MKFIKRDDPVYLKSFTLKRNINSRLCTNPKQFNINLHFGINIVFFFLLKWLLIYSNEDLFQVIPGVTKNLTFDRPLSQDQVMGLMTVEILITIQLITSPKEGWGGGGYY